MASPLFEVIQSVFTQAGWQGIEVEGQEVLETAFEAHHTRIALHIQAFAEINAISVVAESANPVSAPKKHILAELLMRTNETLSFGNFEMVWEQGLALFRTTNLFSPEAIEANIIHSMVHSAVAEMDRLTPFLAILEGTPEAEISQLDVAKLLRREDVIPPVEQDSGLILEE